MDNEEAKQLINRISAGDEAAFNLLYVGLGGKVYAYIAHHLENSADAMEVKVDTFVEVWHQANRFEGRSTVFAWICGIAKYKRLMKLRSRPPLAEDIANLEDSLESNVDTPETLVGKMQDEQGVRTCMKTLSEDHRECVHLAFFQDCSEAEIATIQAVPRGTVKSRISQAKLKLKQCLTRLLRSSPFGGKP